MARHSSRRVFCRRHRSLSHVEVRTYLGTVRVHTAYVNVKLTILTLTLTLTLTYFQSFRDGYIAFLFDIDIDIDMHDMYMYLGIRCSISIISISMYLVRRRT